MQEQERVTQTTQERYRIVIASDKSKSGIRYLVARHLAPFENFQVTISREKIFRIAHEIVLEDPDLVLVMAALDNAEEYQELGGFVYKLRRHIQDTLIVVHAPVVLDHRRERIFAKGADAWISERQEYRILGRILEGLLKREPFYHPTLVLGPTWQGLTGAVR